MESLKSLAVKGRVEFRISSALLRRGPSTSVETVRGPVVEMGTRAESALSILSRRESRLLLLAENLLGGGEEFGLQDTVDGEGVGEVVTSARGGVEGGLFFDFSIDATRFSMSLTRAWMTLSD